MTGGSCRDEVIAALQALQAQTSDRTFTVREVYEVMVGAGSRYAESTVFKTMQRMKAPPERPPYVRLERVGPQGFRVALGV